MKSHVTLEVGRRQESTDCIGTQRQVANSYDKDPTAGAIILQA